MNWRRMFAQAVVRRAAYVVIALLVAAVSSLVGMREARAQTLTCTSPSMGCSVEQAYAQCMLNAQGLVDAATGRHTPHCISGNPNANSGNWAARYITPSGSTGAGGIFYWSGVGCGPGSQWDPVYNNCNSCGTQPPSISNNPPPNGTITCQLSNKPGQYCALHWNQNGDGTATGTSAGGQCKPADFPEECALMEGYYWHPLGAGSCRTIEQEECPAGQELGPDGQCKPPVCPEGMVSNALGICEPDKQQCPPGKERSPDGSCIGDTQCPTGQVNGADGTCKPDADEDGEPDEGENEFVGGDDCNVPPMCSGDPIMCGQARIQWRTECHLRRDYSISGGHCEAVPVCTGRGCNAMEYAQLLQQWKASCALEAIAQGTGGTPGEPGNGDANGNGIPDVLEGDIAEMDVPQGEVGSVGQDAWGEVNTGGWLGGDSCPGLPDVIGAEMSAIACTQGGYIQWLMRLLAVVFAGAIIGRAASGSA